MMEVRRPAARTGLDERLDALRLACEVGVGLKLGYL